MLNDITEKIFLYLLILFLTSSCEKLDYHDILKGSWYTIIKDTGRYEEIHLNDSILVYCSGDDAGVIVPLNYLIQKDTIYVFDDNNVITDKYQIKLFEGNNNQILLQNKDKKLLFNRLDTIINNLDSIFTDTITLDAFAFSVSQRAEKIKTSL